MFKTGDQVCSLPRNPELDRGKHWRAKLGFILMSTDLAAESDFFAMVPEGVAVHITRLKTDDYTTTETLSRHIEAWPMRPPASSPTASRMSSATAAPPAPSSSAKTGS